MVLTSAPTHTRWMTRRDLLAVMLSVPVAYAACRREPAAVRWDGQIVGQSDKLGHQLRDAEFLAPDSLPNETADVVVVGAGIAGLATAWRLLMQEGLKVVLLELELEPGGTAKSGQNHVSRFPWGAHYVPVPRAHERAMIRLLKDMGICEGVDSQGHVLVREENLIRDPEERLFWHGQWWEGLYPRPGASEQDMLELNQFRKEVDFWVGWRDSRGRRAFAIPVSSCSDDAEVMALDRISIREYLDQHGFHSKRLRWYINYTCRDDYGTTLDATSAWASLFYFAARMQNPGEESAPLMTWPEGNGRFVDHLVKQCGDILRLGRAAFDINPSVNGQNIEVSIFARQDSRIEKIVARRVIVASPTFLGPRLIRPWKQEPPAFVSDFHYSPWAVANLTLKDRPKSRGFELAWDNVLYDSQSLGYITATHQALRDHGPTVLSWYYPITDADVRNAREKLLSTTWHDWSDIIVSDLGLAHPNFSQNLVNLDVMRWGHAMIRPEVGFLSGTSRIEARQPFRGIHFANTDLSGIALFEEALDHGVRAAEEVLTSLGQAVVSLRNE